MYVIHQPFKAGRNQANWKHVVHKNVTSSSEGDFLANPYKRLDALLGAGLTHEIARRSHVKEETFRVAVFVPGAHPYRSMLSLYR
ncbi:MAG: hypothetical protein ACFB16_14495 [Phormidesmis sp.]